MGLLVVGSLGLDDIETPFNSIKNVSGGSATYISLAASYFTKPINLVGVVGEDFPIEYIEILKAKGIDLEGLQIIEGGKTFRWAGKYHYDMNVRDTLLTELNVFQDFDPVIPEDYKDSNFVCLGNIDPVLQMRVLKQMNEPKFVVCDTMNYWIEGKKEELLELLGSVNALIINDSETRSLANEPNLIKAAKIILGYGPQVLVIKKGEHGALLITKDQIFSAPAYPLESVFDPTGAGDTFIGGFVGFLHKTNNLSFDNMKKAVIYGSAMASFCVGEFSTIGLEKIKFNNIVERYGEFLSISHF